MTKQERQVRLDKKKWVKSQELHADQTGQMEYCRYCTNYGIRTILYNGDAKKEVEHYCLLTQEQRESLSACATAYNRMCQLKNKRG